MLPLSPRRATIALYAASPLLLIASDLLPVIPPWPLGLTWAAIAVWGCAALWVIVRLVRRGESQPQQKLALLASFILSTAVSYGTLCLVGIDQAFSQPVPKKQELRMDDGRTLYLYEKTCFPPDGRSECGNYSSEARIQIWRLPLTSTIFECRCFFGQPTKKGKCTEIPLEDVMGSTLQVLRIDPDTGRVEAR